MLEFLHTVGPEDSKNHAFKQKVRSQAMRDVRRRQRLNQRFRGESSSPTPAQERGRSSDSRSTPKRSRPDSGSITRAVQAAHLSTGPSPSHSDDPPCSENEGAVPPIIPPNFETMCLVHFFQKFLILDQKRLANVHLQTLANGLSQYGREPALDAAISLIAVQSAHANFDPDQFCHGHRSATINVASAIRSATADPERLRSDELLLAVLLFQYAAVEGRKSAVRFLPNSDGATALIEHRSSNGNWSNCKTTFLTLARTDALVWVIFDNRDCRLDRVLWDDRTAYCPTGMVPSVAEVLSQLMHFKCDVLDLLDTNSHAMVDNTQVDESHFTTLIARGCELGRMMRAWPEHHETATGGGDNGNAMRTSTSMPGGESLVALYLHCQRLCCRLTLVKIQITLFSLGRISSTAEEHLRGEEYNLISEILATSQSLLAIGMRKTSLPYDPDVMASGLAVDEERELIEARDWYLDRIVEWVIGVQSDPFLPQTSFARDDRMSWFHEQQVSLGGEGHGRPWSLPSARCLCEDDLALLELAWGP